MLWPITNAGPEYVQGVIPFKQGVMAHGIRKQAHLALLKISEAIPGPIKNPWHRESIPVVVMIKHAKIRVGHHGLSGFEMNAIA